MLWNLWDKSIILEHTLEGAKVIIINSDLVYLKTSKWNPTNTEKILLKKRQKMRYSIKYECDQ